MLASTELLLVSWGPVTVINKQPANIRQNHPLHQHSQKNYSHVIHATAWLSWYKCIFFRQTNPTNGDYVRQATWWAFHWGLDLTGAPSEVKARWRSIVLDVQLCCHRCCEEFAWPPSPWCPKLPWAPWPLLSTEADLLRWVASVGTQLPRSASDLDSRKPCHALIFLAITNTYYILTILLPLLSWTIINHCHYLPVEAGSSPFKGVGGSKWLPSTSQGSVSPRHHQP